MSEKDAFKERERALEESYFMKREKELIEKMRRRTALEADRGQLSEQTGITNQDVLEALQELGYTPETIKVLHLVPLIHVAWANGKISQHERKLIVEAARASEISENSEADKLLASLLEKAPSETFWEANFLAIRAVLAASGEEERTEMRQSVLVYCSAVATASKGLFGFEPRVSQTEKDALERVVKEIAPEASSAAHQILEGQ